MAFTAVRILFAGMMAGNARANAVGKGCPTNLTSIQPSSMSLACFFISMKYEYCRMRANFTVIITMYQVLREDPLFPGQNE